jgi:hypothetical protein
MSLICPGCGKQLDPARHSELVCDGEVWCDQCRLYDRELLRPREIEDLAAWAARLLAAEGAPPVRLMAGPPQPPPDPLDPMDPGARRHRLLMAEAYHDQRVLVLYPPGCRLATLCHELAHLITGQDHTEAWAITFARMVAWVKAHLTPSLESAGFYTRLL